MDRVLPEQAYNALRGLKGQAQAVNKQIAEKNNCRKDLVEAQKLMSASQPWTSAITKKLLTNKEGVTIEDIDDAWLERVFA